MDKISIIIPVWNGEKYLAEAVDSVLNQKNPPALEVIIVDDGSEDRTPLIAERYTSGECGETRSVKYLRQERGGAAAARNRGIEACSGNYILFLDADDVMTEGAVEAFLQCFASEPEVSFIEAGMEEFISPELTKAGAAELAPQQGIIYGHLGAVMLKRDALMKTGCFKSSLRSGETVDFMIRLRESGLKPARLERVALRRRLHMTNTGRLHRGEEMQNYAAILREKLKNRARN